MRTRFLENSLNSAVVFLLGLCVGVSIVGESLSITSITGIVLSITAVFGITTWKHQIDYKEKKDDRKKLIKSTKLLNASISEAMKEISYAIKAISEIEFVEINTSIIRRQIKIRDSNNSIPQCINLNSEIESELSTNSIINSSIEIKECLRKLILKSEYLIDTLYNSKIILNERLQENILETSIFKKINAEIEEAYSEYSKNYKKTQSELAKIQSN